MNALKIFDERIEIYNPGKLPTGLTIEKLLSGDYRSTLRNRKIADMFKEVGLVEKYGSGIGRIIQGFREYGLPAPKFQEISDGFMVTLYKNASPVTGEVTRLMLLCREPKSRKELMALLGLRHEDHFRIAYLLPALGLNLLEMTIPGKPTSRLQKYRLTARGMALLGK